MQPPAPTTSEETPKIEGQEQPAPKPSRMERLGHWMVTYGAVGIVLNAIISTKLLAWFDNKYPDIKSNAVKNFSNFLVKSVNSFKKNGLTPAGEERVKSIGTDIVNITALGTGGFIVLPLQKFYASHERRISAFFRKLIGSGEKNESPTQTEVSSIAANQSSESASHNHHPATNSWQARIGHSSTKEALCQEKKESLPHWLAGRAVGFTSAIGAYIVLKQTSPQALKTSSRKLFNVVHKYAPAIAKNEKEADYYIGELVATVSSATMLWLTKNFLDHTFPPKQEKSSEQGVGRY